MERKLASIQKILDLQPIEGADAIEVATILGWKVVVKRGEFKIGDLCVYCEIDSIMPDRPEFSFLSERGFRIRTIKLRGQVSQGIAFPMTILNDHIPFATLINEGDDVTVDLGVTKWDPPEVTSGNGDAAGSFPSTYISKTDEIRIQGVPEIINELPGNLFYISEKADGTSSTFIINPDTNEFTCCSRNLRIKDGENKYWDIARKYKIQSILESLYPKTYAIQGEIVGPGIQANRLGLKETKLLVFNVFDVDEARYLKFDEFIQFCEKYKLETVKILKTNVKFSENITVDEFIEMAKGTYESGYPREGIVIRSMDELHSYTLRGRFSFKVINNDFLLKEK